MPKKMSAKAKLRKNQKKKKTDAPKKVKKKKSNENSKKEQKEQIPKREMKEEEQDYSTLLEHIHAHDLKIGMWCIDDNSGYPGRVATLNKSKTGKHGHAKMTYKLVMPHSGKSSIPMHPGKDLIQRPVMEKEECVFIRFMDDEEKTVEVEDANGKKRVIAISPQPKNYEKVMAVMERRGKGDKLVMTVLKGPKYSVKKVVMVECVIEVKSMKGKA